jgi:hypothetical protein
MHTKMAGTQDATFEGSRKAFVNEVALGLLAGKGSEIVEPGLASGLALPS